MLTSSIVERIKQEKVILAAVKAAISTESMNPGVYISDQPGC